MTRALAVVVAAVALMPQLALATGTWHGKVVDHTTGQGIANARVCAGIPGAVGSSCTEVRR